MEGTKHLFATQAEAYAKARPTYPRELFDFLASLTESHDLAWDVATGNGQAASGLAKHYKQIVATDICEQQLAAATQADCTNITYLHLPAVLSEQQCADHAKFFSPRSIDAVNVATAVHWFDLDRFFSVVQRVVKPGGVISCFTYTQPCIDDEVNAAVLKFYGETLNGFWMPNLKLVEQCYQTIPFPFEEIELPDAIAEASKDPSAGDLRSVCSTHANLNYYQPSDVEQRSRPAFLSRCQWTFADLLHFISTWSAVATARKELQRDLMVDCREMLWPAWCNAVKRRHPQDDAIDFEATRLLVIFPIFMRCGRVQ